MGSAPVARPNEKIRVALHEVLSHPNLNPVRQQPIRVTLEGFDIAENVIPSATIQTNRVISELIEDFIHLKNSW